MSLAKGTHSQLCCKVGFVGSACTNRQWRGWTLPSSVCTFTQFGGSEQREIKHALRK